MMSLTRRILAGLTVFAAAISACQTSQATTFLWNVSTPGANNWNVNANWNPNTGNPGIADTAIFGTIGTGPDGVTVNNVVSANTSVANLSYTNTTSGQWHVTQIPAPNKLTVTNSFTVGGLTIDGIVTLAAMTGDGTFEADGNAFKVGNAATAANSALNATLDMSALSNFVYYAPTGTWIVAGSGADARGGGVLNLAGASNNITVGTINFNTGSGNNSSFHSLIQLGSGTNIFNVGNFIVGQTKAQFSTVQFFPGAPATAGLRIRGTNGNSDDSSRANITLGDRNNSGAANTDGEMLLNGHPVDIKANNLLIGQVRSSTSTSANGGIGVLQFDTGTVDATTVTMGVATSAGASTTATGTLIVGANGKLIAGSGGIVLGRRTGGAGVTNNLNIFGTAFSSNNIAKTTNTVVANIDLTGGKLTMISGVIGTPDAPIDNFTMASTTLTLPVLNNSTNIVVNNFNPVDAASVINITSLPVLSGYPSQFPVISYQGLIGGGSISIGTLPGTFQGYVTNDTTVNTVFLVVTNGPVTSKLDQWVGNINSTWDTSTLNWLSSSAPAAYTENDSVAFDDSATTGTVNYSTTHTPLSMAFNNNSLNYTLGGSGKISGPSSLVQSGGGSVALSASGGDNFSGGITVNAGSVLLDNANSAITGPLTIVGGAKFQVGNNDANGNIPSASIANDGMLVINRADNLGLNTSITGNGSLVKLGNGTLTLSNGNSYFGDTALLKGTLALAANGSITNSGNLIASNATFDVSSLARVVTFNNGSFNDSAITLNASNAFAPVNFSSLAMGGSANTINISALPGIPNYPVTIDLIHSAGGISGYNAVRGSLPAGSVGSISLSADTTTIQLTLTSGPIGTRSSVRWTGADVPNLNTNWSDGLNWQLPGAPTAIDNVIFNGTAVVSDALTIDNIVDASTAINTLRYTNIVNNQWHVTSIPAGVTLTVSSNLTVGGLTQDGNPVTLAAMTGGGTFAVSGTTLNIGNTGPNANSTGTTLDLSGLSNFVYNVPAGTIAMGIGTRSAAHFKMANGSNYITATNFNDNIPSSSSSGTGNLTLGGGTNIFNVGNFNISAGRVSSTVTFPDVTGGIRVRGVGGTDNDRATMTIGNRNNGGGSGNSITGTLALNGHPVDMKLSTLTMGFSGSNPTGTANGNGVLSFDTGTIDVNGIVLAVATGTTVGVQASGIINLGNSGTLIVGNGGINMGSRTGASGTNNAVLNIGGALTCSGNIVKSTNSSTGTITVTNGGTLKMLSGVIGTPAAPIDNLNLDTAMLQLSVNGATSVTNISALNITAANITTINIGAIANITAPATVSLISYQPGTADPFANLVLGSLPAGAVATLQDNTANSTIDLNITTAPAPSVPPTISKVSIVGGNIVISGTNNSGAGGTFHVLTSTNVALPLTNWAAVTNGTFNSSGNFNTTNAIDSTKPRGFYILQVP